MSIWNSVKSFGQDVISSLTSAPKKKAISTPPPAQAATLAPANTNTSQPRAGSSSVFPSLEKWAETPHRTGRAIPVRDEEGNQRYRSGWSDPKAWRAWQAGETPEPTPVSERLKRGMGGGIPQTIDAIRRIIDPNVTFDGYLEDNLVSPVLTGLEVLNDFNDRVGNFRRNRSKDPEFEYETPQGNKFTTSDITPFFEVAGKLMTEDQFGTIQKEGVTWLDPKDAHLADDINEDGEPYTFAGYRLPDGSVVAKDQYNPNWVYDALPDGTIFQYADGSKPDEQVSYRQTNAGFWGPKDPRAPWEDRSGNVAFFDEDYDVSDSAIDEIIPWFIDMNLQSSPYYVPYYRYAAAAGRSAPYVQGLSGATYENDGPISQLGLGTYGTDSVTRAQALGGALAPPVDSWMERLSGQAIGGLEKKLPEAILRSAPGRFLNDTALGRLIGAALTEGVEEIPAQFFDTLEQDSLADYGRRGHYNHQTGEMEYDPDSRRGDELPKSMFEAWGGGAVLGAGMGGAKELPMALLRRGARIDPRKAPDSRTPRSYRVDGRSQMPDPDSEVLKPKVERKE